MRVVFLGTPRFAVPSLEALAGAGHHVCAVLTQPDRPKGRGQELAVSPVKEAALRLGLDVHQPPRVRRPEVLQMLSHLAADVIVVVGYGQIIPQSIIDLPPLGIINVHASLLPRYRGAAPIQWAIAMGETVTGNTTMRIDAGLDTGDMLLSSTIDIGPEETAVELSDRMAQDGARLLLVTLSGLRRNEIVPRPQNHDEATLAPILKKEDGCIDWHQPASQIHNRIRGFQPWPGGFSGFRGQLLHIWKSRPVIGGSTLEPGRLAVLERRRLVAGCGGGTVLELLEVQLEGKKRVDAASFINGQRLNDAGAAPETLIPHLGETR